jgi:hypothetical protein
MVFKFSVTKIPAFHRIYLNCFFSREYFYQNIEKSARQYLADGVRNADELIVTPNSELYRALNLHYNRSNQINVKSLNTFFCYFSIFHRFQ